MKNAHSEEDLLVPQEVEAAIKKTRSSKALGPDELESLILKKLGTNATAYITEMFNRSIKHSVIPGIWKCSRVIPLLKPGKPADQAKSYRPVSLLSPLIKLLETSMLPFVLESFSHAEHRHGFRKGHSTNTALCEIDDHIRTGLNRRKPAHKTFMVFLDLRAAFDTVNINKLIETIENLNLHVNIKRWLKNYLHGRQAKVEFRNSVSKGRTISSDVPQGGVLSPCLFNIYMATAPIPPEDEKLVSYADDCTVLSSGPIISEIETKTNSYLAVLLKWFEENSFDLSPGKSSATIFTTFSNESRKYSFVFQHIPKLIPKGRISSILPGFLIEAEKLMRQRDDVR